MKFPHTLPRVPRLRAPAGVLRIFAPAALVLGAVVALVLTATFTQASGPPDLGSGFSLPILLEQGRTIPVQASPGAQQQRSTSELPITPTGLQVSLQPDSLIVALDWDDIAGATEYLVRWRLKGPGQKLNAGVRSTTSETRITVTDYGDWVVRVQACNDAGCGRPSTRHFVLERALQLNRAPVLNENSEQHAAFADTSWAPRGIYVSKAYEGVFSDPDGDTLTYNVSVPEDRSGLVDAVEIQEHTQRLFVRLRADGDWGAVTPALDNPLVTRLTLTATDPGGLSASVVAEFHTLWTGHPILQSAQEDGQGDIIELTFSQAVQAEPGPAAEQFTVQADDGEGSVETIAVDNVSVKGRAVTLELASALPAHRVITLDYVHNDSAPLRAAGGGSDVAPSFTGQAVERKTQVRSVSAGPAYRGQLGEVLVELSLRRPAPAASPGGASVRSVTPQTTSIVYVVDDSGSMEGDFPEVRTALRKVRDATMANTKVALIAFGQDPKTVFGLTSDSTDGLTGPWTEERIESFGGRLGGTEYEAPLESAKALLDADDADTKKIILLTDAQSNVLNFITGFHYLVPPETIQEIEDAGVIVDTIGFGDHFSVNFDGLEQIATGTGGEHRAVTKPSQGTTNEPSVTEKSITDILEGAVADNTATLFLVDHSGSFRRTWKAEWDDSEGIDYDYTLIDGALNAAATKAGDASGTGRQVGLATFLGESTYISHPEARSPHPRYQVIHGIGSSSLIMPDPLVQKGWGSTDIDHALQQAYSTISKVTADNKRVVLITDGISAVEVQESTLDSYKEEDAPVTLDVVAWSDHADRVKLKTWADSAGGNFSVAKSPPLAPRRYDLRTILGPDSFVLKWADPEDPAITKYQYRQYDRRDPNTGKVESGWSSRWIDIPGAGPNTNWYIFTGLDYSVQYDLQVRAVRGDTPGARSVTGKFRPYYARGLRLGATSGDGQVDLTWNRQPWWLADIEEGKGDFKENRYSLREDDGPWSDWTTIPDATDATESYTITGLTNGTVYSIALLRVLEKDGETHNTAFETTVAWPNNFPTGTPIITGTAQVGERLTVDASGISDADGLDNAEFIYLWFVDDVYLRKPDDSPTPWHTYTIGADDEGKTIKGGVYFSDDAGNRHQLVTAPVGPVAAATAGAAVMTSSPRADNTYRLGDTIQVTLTFSEAVDVTGTPRLKIKMDPNYGEKWATYDQSRSGTSGLTFTYEVVQPNVSTQGIAALANTLELNGGTIKFTATGTDADLAHGGLAHDANHKVDWQANISATGEPSISGTRRVGETLWALESDIADPNGLDNATFSYQWLADDADISGATNWGYTLVEADEGKAIKVRVSFTDGAGHAETLTSRATAAVAPESNSAASGQPTISGAARVGVTLTAGTSGIADADGLDNAAFRYQWLADDANIYVSTSSTYTLTAAEEGKAVKVRVSFTDDEGFDESLTSEATSTVVSALPPSAPTNLVASDNGNGTLTLTWDAPEDDNVTGYQILRRRPSEGEGTLLVYVADTGSTDTTTWTDGEVTVGIRHVYGVKAINSAGLSRVSNLDGATPASPPENNAAAGAPTITGTAQVGATLTAGTSGISDDDGLDNATFSYRWLADDADISGATNSTYTLADADAGKAVKVKVSFTDDGGNAETVTSTATAAVAAVTPPDVTSVAVTSSPASGDTYALGETIRLTLTFSEAVDVTGTPRLKIDMDPAHWGEKWATYESGSGATSLTFVHEVVQPNISTQGIAVLEDTLELNGGAIKSTATEADADLSHTGLAHDANHKVAWQ